MTHIGSYPSIYNFGHNAVRDLLSGPVVVEEKVDGSQFSFGVTEDGDVVARSKGKDLVIDAPEKMFERGIASVLERKDLLQRGWIYRGEYLQKPKHNTLAYDRHPNGHVIIFDINTGTEMYLTPSERAAEATRIGLESVPVIYEGVIESSSMFDEFLSTVSVLGGQKVEGVVIKPAGYGIFGSDKKVLMAKYVSEAFKEIHAGEWKKSNPTRSDIVDQLILDLKTPARWGKAVQHLRERGELTNSPKDIGPLLKEVQADVKRECEEEIKSRIFAHVWSKVQRGIVAGLPEWYKRELLESAFDNKEDAA